MDTLINFDNLRKVLEEFAEDFRETYRAQLVEHDRVTQYGKDRLIDSVDENTVDTMVQAGDQAWTVSIKLNDYWKYIESGTKPHWPPPSAILRWVQVKPVIPRPDAKGRIPSQKSLAFLIGRKISKEGTEGSHDFQDARTATIERFRERIAEAVGHDFENYIRKVFA
jgi:hypothetical protein